MKANKAWFAESISVSNFKDYFAELLETNKTPFLFFTLRSIIQLSWAFFISLLLGIITYYINYYILQYSIYSIILYIYDLKSFLMNVSLTRRVSHTVTPIEMTEVRRMAVAKAKFSWTYHTIAAYNWKM